MEQTLLGRMLFGKDVNELIGQHNELIGGLALLKLRCPEVWWVVERAIINSKYHDEHCVPFFKQFLLAKEQWKRDKEELVYLREVVINLEEEIVKLKVAKRKATVKSKKSKSKR